MGGGRGLPLGLPAETGLVFQGWRSPSLPPHPCWRRCPVPACTPSPNQLAPLPLVAQRGGWSRRVVMATAWKRYGLGSISGALNQSLWDPRGRGCIGVAVWEDSDVP